MTKIDVKRLLVLPATLVLLGSMLASACEDEVIVEVERPFFEDPPATAVGYLGYDEEAANLTVCGNCHVGKQSEWEETGHADAWESLIGSGSAQPFCENCHTVSQNGNPSETDGGWATTQDTRYHDVQCENCHGPGEAHGNNPDASQPLAEASVGLELDTGCGECHEGTHHPFTEEWEDSPHSGVIGFAAARAECAPCHKGQTSIEAFGENANYTEKFDADPLPVVCVVCHDPHADDIEHQLRFPVDTPSIELHLCSQCHNRRTIPDPESSHGLEPHSPESALLVGNAGWFPPGAPIDRGQIRGTHGSEANPELCATCHLAKSTITDAATGDFVFNATGHLFRPIPCVDASGIPQGFEVDCDLAPPARTYESCTGGGCHGDEQAAFSALTAASTRIQALADELEELLAEVDPNGEDPGGEIDPTNPTFTVAEGAFFNHALALFGNEDFGTFTVIGSATHNPFLMEALLIGSIDAVEEEYGVMNSLGVVDWDAELQVVKSRAGR